MSLTSFFRADKSSLFTCQTSFPQTLNTNSKPCLSEFASLTRQKAIPPAEILYILNPEVDLEKLLLEINLNLVEMLNQITFCRIGLAKELIKIKVTDKLVKADEPTRQMLKKKYESIQEIKKRDMFKLFETLDKTSQVTQKIHRYNPFEALRNYLLGTASRGELIRRGKALQAQRAADETARNGDAAGLVQAARNRNVLPDRVPAIRHSLLV